MAGKYFLAALAKPCPVLLQALLNRSIVAQLLSAKTLRISTAGLLLSWGVPMWPCANDQPTKSLELARMSA
jgi:hypothetical protein